MYTRRSGRKIAYLGLLTAAAMILSYVESLFPVFGGVPGMKLGLPNAAIVMVLYLYTWKEALLVSFVRILGVGLLFGNAFSMAFSIAGALLSLLSGGVMHNAGQILVAIFIVENARVGYYFFILAISGLVTGLVIGLISGELVKRMRIAIRNDGSL